MLLAMGHNLWWEHQVMKKCVTVMLEVTVDGSMLPPYVILSCKTTPKDALPRGITIRCQPKSWMTSKLTKDLLLVVCRLL